MRCLPGAGGTLVCLPRARGTLVCLPGLEILSLSHNTLSSLVGMPRSMHALRLLSVAHNQVDTEYPKYPPQRTHAATDSRHLSLQQANGHVPRASAQTNKLTLQITSLEGLSAMRTIKYPCEYPEYPCEYPRVRL
jgi:hypothetical protein